MTAFRIPKDLAPRLSAVARARGFRSIDELARHLVLQGLAARSIVATDPLPAALERFVDEYGYSSVSEAVEHLLVRGLQGEEGASASPGDVETRLRGLGYLD